MARRTPLYERHDAAGATFTEFGGWEMPVDFGSIREEHRHVRTTAGAFDVSHMGELAIGGADATTLIQRLTTNDVTALDPGRAQYSAMTDEDGAIVDDTVVYRLPDDDGVVDDSATHLVVPNAGHDADAAERWTRYRDEWGLDATVENRTESIALLAIQGPDAPGLVADAAADPEGSALRDLSRFGVRAGEIAGVDCLFSRTGYTGEDGFEIFCPWAGAEAVWDATTGDCGPCGLGARDTLRIEMGFLLSGQDFHPMENPRTPYEAGIGFVVDLDAEPAFVGHDALVRADREGPAERFVGVRLHERGVPRHGYPILDPDGERIGEVTSGTMSPTLEEAIGLGYVPIAYADEGTDVTVEIRGEPKSATVVTPPFLEADE